MLKLQPEPMEVCEHLDPVVDKMLTLF